MQQRPPPDDPIDDAKPRGDSGGTRTPAGSDYGDFHPTRRHERSGEPYADDEPQEPPLPPELYTPPSRRR
jgi:hypothetical protein